MIFFLRIDDPMKEDDVVCCFIEATLKHSKAPGAVRASKKRRLLPKGAKAGMWWERLRA